MIAAAPTYAAAGLLSPAILVIARMIQGLSLGGEYGSSATYLSEMAGRERRGFRGRVVTVFPQDTSLKPPTHTDVVELSTQLQAWMAMEAAATRYFFLLRLMFFQAITPPVPNILPITPGTRTSFARIRISSRP